MRDTPQDNAKAVLHFEQAIALDPNYGQAYAGLASAYFNACTAESGNSRWGYHSLTSSRSSWRVFEALKHPTPEAYRVNAYILQYQFKLDEAIAGLERAIAGRRQLCPIGRNADLCRTDRGRKGLHRCCLPRGSSFGEVAPLF